MADSPFDESRRLTGINPYFDECGAALEALGEYINATVLRDWRANVERLCAALHWPAPHIVVLEHASGASLAFTAPVDQLYSATEVNEWALLAALPVAVQKQYALDAPEQPVGWDEEAALCTLRTQAREEHIAGLAELVATAATHGLNVLLDEEALTIGSGVCGHTWPLDALPQPDAVPWGSLGDIPMALVTGSNGKTTTVRLLAAMARVHGWRCAHSCTDGVFSDGAMLEAGDYSGPAGARATLRQSVEAAVLETARGGILRHGLAMQHARAAVVTNVSDDHFGEYGIHDLGALAQVKLTVARPLGEQGVLAINADDALLVRHAERLQCELAWFAHDDAHPLLETHRAQGGSTCAVRDGHLHLFHAGADHDLGVIDAMPLTFAGRARYNIGNIAAATLAAAALDIDAVTIADVLMRFGSSQADNPGRLQQWDVHGIKVLVDYAHNPEGLRALLEVVAPLRGDGRLGLVLGQAGNREDDDIRALAAAAAAFAPDRVMLKDIAGYERGRTPGEVAALLRDELARHGCAGDAVIECLDEFEAARHLLEWAHPGDMLVLPIHAAEAREQVNALLSAAQASRG
ncbi:MAG: Mur ligase family protein [Gammaproteobacteria bacterium]